MEVETEGVGDDGAAEVTHSSELGAAGALSELAEALCAVPPQQHSAGSGSRSSTGKKSQAAKVGRGSPVSAEAEEAAIIAAWRRRAAYLRERPEEASQMEKEMLAGMHKGPSRTRS